MSVVRCPLHKNAGGGRVVLETTNLTGTVPTFKQQYKKASTFGWGVLLNKQCSCRKNGCQCGPGCQCQGCNLPTFTDTSDSPAPSVHVQQEESSENEESDYDQVSLVYKGLLTFASPLPMIGLPEHTLPPFQNKKVPNHLWIHLWLTYLCKYINSWLSIHWDINLMVPSSTSSYVDEDLLMMKHLEVKMLLWTHLMPLPAEQHSKAKSLWLHIEHVAHFPE